MRWLNADPLFVSHLATVLNVVPTINACQLSEFDDEVPIAGVLWDGYNGQTIHAHMWLNHTHRPSRMFYWAVCDYAFRQLGVENVLGTVPSSNEAAIRLNHHLGFRDVGMLHHYYPNNDDMLLMLCTPESVFDYGRLKPQQVPFVPPITVAA